MERVMARLARRPGVHFLQQHRKVRLWWTDTWAVQHVRLREFSYGIRREPARPLTVLFCGAWTVEWGAHPVLQRNTIYSDIGFIDTGDPDQMLRELRAARVF